MTKFQELKSRLRSEYPDQKDALDAAAAIEELEEALRPLAYIDIELLDKDGKPTGVYSFDAYHEHQVVFGIGKDRTITANDLRRARAALGETK